MIYSVSLIVGHQIAQAGRSQVTMTAVITETSKNTRSGGGNHDCNGTVISVSSWHQHTHTMAAALETLANRKHVGKASIAHWEQLQDIS